jgi:hypothetical protein
MVESGLGGQFWFNAAMAKDACNVTYKERIRMTPYLRLYMYGRNKDISKLRSFGCQVYMYLNEGEADCLPLLSFQ